MLFGYVTWGLDQAFIKRQEELVRTTTTENITGVDTKSSVRNVATDIMGVALMDPLNPFCTRRV